MMTAVPSSPPAPPPRISVIVPVRNDPHNLRRCLDALRASTFQEFETIVVDDGSSDESGFVARRRGARVLRSDVSGGPAVARNAGADIATGEILFFVDADVCVHPDTLAQLLATLDSDPTVAAVFGSYDTAPDAPALVSQYKNLSHHFVHQHARTDAGTFWTGCGGVRREVFLALGGFDTDRYTRPCIEDIDLGVRLRRAGHRIVLNKSMQATHLKRWTLGGMVRSDVFDRGIPWTRLILRTSDLPNDLNLGLSQRLSALLAGLVVLATLVVAWWQPLVLALPAAAFALIIAADAWTARWRVPRVLSILIAPALLAGVAAGAWPLQKLALPLLLPLAGIILLNVRYYAFFLRQRGLAFTLAVLPLHVLYYLYSGFALVTGTLQHMTARHEPHRSDPAPIRQTPAAVAASRREVA